MEAQKNLPAKNKAETIRQLFDNPTLKRQVQLAIPKHMTVDRLLRVAMTAIRTNPKLMDCTPKSLMSCLMGCAQLGLEPEPFLGQAYFVPFKNKMGQLEAQLIPGYRGYISLARRSGEVQSVSAQVVYENDKFHLQYGLNETLDHVPADGDRGDFKGAYVVFRYKDGSHSFDYMTAEGIDRIRSRSKAKDSGPWVTDYDEMAKKTVIRRHVKLAPLSIEMAKAAAMEERAMIGETQADMIFGSDNGVGELPEPVPEFDDLLKARPEWGKNVDEVILGHFLVATAQGNGCTVDEVKEMARKDFDAFWASFLSWQTKQDISKKKPGPKPKESPTPEGQLGSQEQDMRPNSTMILCPEEKDEEQTLGWCRDNCISNTDCQAWKEKA